MWLTCTLDSSCGHCLSMSNAHVDLPFGQLNHMASHLTTQDDRLASLSYTSSSSRELLYHPSSPCFTLTTAQLSPNHRLPSKTSLLCACISISSAQKGHVIVGETIQSVERLRQRIMEADQVIKPPDVGEAIYCKMLH